MTERVMDSLVSTQWLAGHLGEPDLAIVDSSWHMPATGRNGRAEYLEAHIPGARFLDIDAVSDRSSRAPHMLPSAADFGAAMERVGVGRNNRIVVYDNSPLRTAARNASSSTERSIRGERSPGGLASRGPVARRAPAPAGPWSFESSLPMNLFGNAYEAFLEVGCLGSVQFDHQAPAAFERDAHDQAAALLGDFHWAVAGAWFHSRHEEFPSI